MLLASCSVWLHVSGSEVASSLGMLACNTATSAAQTDGDSFIFFQSDSLGAADGAEAVIGTLATLYAPPPLACVHATRLRIQHRDPRPV